MLKELTALKGLETAVRECFGDSFAPQYQSIKNALLAVSDARQAALTNNSDPNSYGEFLRDEFFVGDGYGCYSTFELATAFSPVDKGSDLGKNLLRCLFSDCGWFEDPNAEEHESEVPRANLFSSATHVVAWWWDGDGTLLVGERDGDQIVRAAINGDCKKDYDWAWLPADVLSMNLGNQEKKMANGEPHQKVEYDLSYSGGDYSGVGNFAYIPESAIDKHGSVEAAFEAVTGIDRCHIVCTYDDERVTATGDEYPED